MSDVTITSVVNTPSSEVASKTFVAATYAPIAEPLSLHIDQTVQQITVGTFSFPKVAVGASAVRDAVNDNAYIKDGRLTIERTYNGSTTALALYNPDANDNSAILISYRADSYGAGATAFKEMGAFKVKFVTHDHATCASEFSLFNMVGGTLKETLKLLSTGGITVIGDITTSGSVKGVHKAADGTAAVADGTYTVGCKITPVTGNNGTITIKDGIITAIQQAT